MENRSTMRPQERPRPLGNERPDPLIPAYPQITTEEDRVPATEKEHPEGERLPADDEQPEEGGEQQG